MYLEERERANLTVAFDSKFRRGMEEFKSRRWYLEFPCSLSSFIYIYLLASKFVNSRGNKEFNRGGGSFTYFFPYSLA